nr:CehA/McbA family metallohydrolase [Micromonospora sp. DSM 115978]
MEPASTRAVRPFLAGPPAGRGRGWYRGDCHVHTVLSTAGELTADQIAAAARTAGLDFIATTEHNTAAGHGAWTEAVRDGLLVVLGQEVVTESGHWLALGVPPGQVIDWRYRAGDGAVDRQLDRVRGHGGLTVAAHPYAPYPTGTFRYPYHGFDAVEVWNGRWASDLPWNADNEAALAEWGAGLGADIRAGRWRPAIGNSDVHLAGQLGVPQTVVRADELSAGAVLAGILAGRCWIAGSAAVDLSVTAGVEDRRAGVGERLAAAGDQPVVVEVAVVGVPGGVVSLRTDRGEVRRATLPGGGSGALRWSTTARESLFVRIEVRGRDGQMAALTNPVILG